MDYSIFLWHSYEENKGRYPGDNNRAMAHAISQTIVSVVGSSITTVAGFLAMCFMTFTLGMDLGIVMAKGVVFGVIGCVTILPSMILIFDKAIEKDKTSFTSSKLTAWKICYKTLLDIYNFIPCNYRTCILWTESQSGLLRFDGYSS